MPEPIMPPPLVDEHQIPVATNPIQTTLLVIKPDAVAAHHIGAILNHCEGFGFTLTALRRLQVSPTLAKQLYAEHAGQPYFPNQIHFFCSGPVVAVALQGIDAVSRLRSLVGPTRPQKAPIDTLRGRYGTGVPQNAVHASDSPEAAARELSLFFPELSGSSAHPCHNVNPNLDHPEEDTLP